MKPDKELKPCPFCGGEAKKETFYYPCEVSISCHNTNCEVKPYIYISCPTKENLDGKTFTPLFDDGFAIIVDKWNRRSA